MRGVGGVLRWEDHTGGPLGACQFATDGKIVPVIDRSYPLADIADALRHAETGKARGKIVVTI
jgi:NADPH:quinone reductase-like Zn-dependent oxidoreductase